MPFETARKRKSVLTIQNAREKRKKDQNVEEANHPESGDEIGGVVNTVEEIQQSSNTHDVSSETEKKMKALDLNSPMLVSSHNNPHTPSASQSLPDQLDRANLLDQIEQVTAENGIYLDENIELRETVFSIRKSNSKYEAEIARITVTIAKVRISRDEYKRKLSLSNRKLKRKSLPKFRRLVIAESSRRFYAYSQICNFATKEKRKKQSLAALQDIAKEKDVHELLDDVIQLCDKAKDQSFQFKLSIWQAMVLKSKANLSRRQLEVIKRLMLEFTGRDFLPSVKTICEVGKQQSRIDLFEETVVQIDNGETYTVVQCKNLLELIIWRLESISSEILFDEYSGEDIIIGFGGDSGGGNTKLCLIFGNLKHPNSIDNVIVIGVYDGKDSCELIEKLLPELIRQFNELTSVTYVVDGSPVTRNVQKKVTGDFRFICELLTHMKQNARYFCPYCECQNERGRFKPTLKDLTNFQSPPRTIKSYIFYARRGQKGVYKGNGPLFPTVNILDYLVGMLHLCTGLFQRYIFNPLWVECVTNDNSTQFSIVTDKATTERLAADKIEKISKQYESCRPGPNKNRLKVELESLKAEETKLADILLGIPNGRLKSMEKCWESLGASRRAYFQMFNGNHTKKLLTQSAIEKTFDIFSDIMNNRLRALKRAMENLSQIMSLSANKILSDDELQSLTTHGWEFLDHLVDGFPDDSVTQKMHVLLYHCEELATRQKTLGRINEQGIEAKHAQSNTLDRRFCCYRNKSSRWLLVVQEMLCSTVANDYLKA